MRFHVHNMIVAVSRTGSGNYISDVLDFQNAWNRNHTLINTTLRRIGSSQRWFSLVEDGKFGPNTSRAARYFMPGDTSSFPTRASAMPVWYAQNNGMVEDLVAPTSPPLQATQIDPGATHDQAAVEGLINGGGSTVRNVVPTSIPAPANSQPGPLEVVNREMPADAAVEIMNLDFDAESGSNVIGTRVASRVPWLAVGIGAIGLGGAMAYWLKKKKRR